MHLFSSVFRIYAQRFIIPAFVESAEELTYSVTNSHWSSSSFMYDPASIYSSINSCILRWYSLKPGVFHVACRCEPNRKISLISQWLQENARDTPHTRLYLCCQDLTVRCFCLSLTPKVRGGYMCESSRHEVWKSSRLLRRVLRTLLRLYGNLFGKQISGLLVRCDVLKEANPVVGRVSESLLHHLPSKMKVTFQNR